MTRSSTLSPIDFIYPESVPLDNGCLFITLRTLDELEAFCRENGNRYPFAAEGIILEGRPPFLMEYEWVFGTSKEEVVKTACRWDQVGIQCAWENWADHDQYWMSFFEDRDLHRQSLIEEHKWTEQDEKEYVADCILRSPTTYRGFWVLSNLPYGYTHRDWFGDWDEEEIFDPALSAEVVAGMFQLQTFDTWKESECTELLFHDSASLQDTIAYWREEQKGGQDYYGKENEHQI
jgi:hypothetical protein